jgi:hypothetical protein
VISLLDEFGLNREAHLVIRNGTLVPGDAGGRAAVVESLGRCTRCGSPTTSAGLGGGERGAVCAFCRLVEVAAAHDPVPVEMLHPAKARR